jgi:glycosyltransferase involved in cell wall biosynthesis
VLCFLRKSYERDFLTGFKCQREIHFKYFMKISTIIILYNFEKYIDDAIQSVLGQTRQSDEIIVVDDCSTDGSSDIVAKYRDRVIHIKQEENIGALRNSLAGLKAATGDVVAFLDADDVWMSKKLEAIEKEFLEDEEVVLVSHDFIEVDENLQYVHDWNISNETRLNTRRITKRYAKKDWSEKIRESILLRKGFWLGSAYAVRKKAIQLERFERLIAQHAPANLAYLEGFRLRDTLDLVLGSFIVASNPTSKVGFINEVLFKHREHGNNTWNSTLSIEMVLRNAESWQLMNATTYHLIANVLTDKKIERRYTNLRDEMELVKFQFTGKKLKAIGKFISVSPFLFKGKRIAREFARLLAITFLGPESFIRWRIQRNSK